MTTLAQAKKVAAKFGANLIDEKSGNCHCCRIEAPAHHKWMEGDVHELVDETNRPWKPDYADLINRMNHGVEVCTNPECEWCES